MAWLGHMYIFCTYEILEHPCLLGLVRLLGSHPFAYWVPTEWDRVVEHKLPHDGPAVKNSSSQCRVMRVQSPGLGAKILRTTGK